MIEEARLRLNRGEVILLGTDTVPGLHALADREQACMDLRGLKSSPPGRPFLLLFASMDRALRYSRGLDPAVKQSLELAWPGPLTAILPAGDELAPWWGDNQTFAARVPAHVSLRALLDTLDYPLFSTSANLAGEETAKTVALAQRSFPDLYALDFGDQSAGTASTLVDCTSAPGRVLRPGAAPWPPGP